MSLSSVNGVLSTLKQCQVDIGTGMDIVTDVAMDLMEAEDGEMTSGIKQMEAMLLECAKLDRDINIFIDVAQEVTSEITPQQPETMFRLSDKVKQRFDQRTRTLSDADLDRHQKVMAFKKNVMRVSEQANENSEANMEVLDDDIAVTQSQVNFTCPLTQVVMVNPVKNKKCNHYYDEAAIVNLIKTKQSQQKKCRCPVVGCGNSNVKQSDLVVDQLLRRKIQEHTRLSNTK